MSYTQLKEDVFVVDSLAGFYALMLTEQQVYPTDPGFPVSLPNQYPCVVVLVFDSYTGYHSFTMLSLDNLIKAVELISGSPVRIDGMMG